MTSGRILISPVAGLLGAGANLTGIKLAAFAAANFTGLAECYLACYGDQAEAGDLAAAKAKMMATIRGDFGKVLPGVSPTALLDGKVVGSLQIVQAVTPDLGCPVAIELFVHPDERRKGIASTLLAHAASRLQMAGFDQLAVSLGESASPDTVVMLNQLGFTDLDTGAESA